MTDLKQQAHEVLREHGIIGGKHLPQTIAAMLAFRAAQPGEAEWPERAIRIAEALEAEVMSERDGSLWCRLCNRDCGADGQHHARTCVLFNDEQEALATPPRRPALDREAVAEKLDELAELGHSASPGFIRQVAEDAAILLRLRPMSVEEMARVLYRAHFDKQSPAVRENWTHPDKVIFNLNRDDVAYGEYVVMARAFLSTTQRLNCEAVRPRLFDALRNAFFAGRESKPPKQYDSEAVEAAWNRDIDAILSLLPTEPVQEMREGERLREALEQIAHVARSALTMQKIARVALAEPQGEGK